MEIISQRGGYWVKDVSTQFPCIIKVSKKNPLNKFNLHQDNERGWHYHVTPGQYPQIIGGYWGHVDERNRRRPTGRNFGGQRPGGRRPPPGGPNRRIPPPRIRN